MRSGRTRRLGAGVLASLLLVGSASAEVTFGFDYLALLDPDGDFNVDTVLGTPASGSDPVPFSAGPDVVVFGTLDDGGSITGDLSISVDGIDPVLASSTLPFVEVDAFVDMCVQPLPIQPSATALNLLEYVLTVPVVIASTAGGFASATVPIRFEGTLDGTFGFIVPDVGAWRASVNYVATEDDAFSFGSVNGFFQADGVALGTPGWADAATYSSSTSGGETTATFTWLDAPIGIDFDVSVTPGATQKITMLELRQFLDVGIDNFGGSAGTVSGQVTADFSSFQIDTITSPAADVTVTLPEPGAAGSVAGVAMLSLLRRRRRNS